MQPSTTTEKANSQEVNTKWMQPGTQAWIPVPENAQTTDAFYLGQINEIEGNKVKVKYGMGEVNEFDASQVYQLNDYKKYPNGFADMVDMEILNDAEVLNNIRLRYDQGKIFTYVDSTLIVVNPFQMMDKEFTPELFKEFQECAKELRLDFKEHPPHCWGVASNTMIELIKKLKSGAPKNQAIIITGESGAGKTENTKYCMKLLTSIGTTQSLFNNKGNISTGEEMDSKIEDKILACSPVLEAFGNATTALNDNSSRFGKYVSLIVDKNSLHITGAAITNYMLEKSRVVTQGTNERNYHIFYHIFRGASSDELDSLLLKINGKVEMSKFQFFKSKRFYVENLEDSKLYQRVVNSFQTMNFTKEEQEAIWKTTAAVLWLGNIEFDESTRTESNPCKIVDEDPLQRFCKLLSLDYDTLVKCFTVKIKIVVKDIVTTPLQKIECTTARDSLAKELYNRLFNWLVKRLNHTILPPEDLKNGIRIELVNRIRNHIGILDIFGFEVFETNSLEQFCINYTNEKLHYLYIDCVFNSEAKEFQREELMDYFVKTTPKDNSAVIELMSVSDKGSISIFKILDELCTISSDDERFLMRLKQIHKDNKKFETPLNVKKNEFVIHHTAKDVIYNVTGFRAKNMDELLPSLEEALVKSSNPDVVRIFKGLVGDEKETEATKKKISKFLGKKFQDDMEELYTELKNCNCHHIRCIKPNPQKKKGLFNQNEVLNQIKYMGVLESIKIRRDGYPIRKTYIEFYNRYRVLTTDFYLTMEEIRKSNANYKDLAIKLCQKVIPEYLDGRVIFGKTRIFMKMEGFTHLEDMIVDILKLRNDSAQKIQKAWKRSKKMVIIGKYIRAMERHILVWRLKRKMQVYIYVNKFVKQIQIEAFNNKHGRCVRAVQRRVRRFLARQKMAIIRNKIIKIQSIMRVGLAKKQIMKIKADIKLRKCAVKIQCAVRRLIAQRVFANLQHELLLRKKATKIQAVYRGHVQRKIYSKTLYNMRLYRWARETALNILRFVNIHIEKDIYTKVQGIIRKAWIGYKVRKQHRNEVRKIREAWERVAFKKYSTKIQKNVKGWIVRSTLRRLNYAAQLIQASVKMIWYTILLRKLRMKTLIIQRAVRKWIYKKRFLEMRLREFLADEHYEIHRRRVSEQFTLLGNLYKEEPKKYDFNQMLHTSHRVEFDSDSLKAEPRVNTLNNTFARTIKKQTTTPYDEKKIKTFVKLIDIDILMDTSEIYDEFWSLTALRLQKDLTTINSDMLMAGIGETHTVVASDANKLYSWGFNGQYQLGRTTSMVSSDDPAEISIENLKPRTLIVGDNHNMLLDYFGNLHLWGSNEHGQYGMGHQERMDEVAIIKFLPENENIYQISGRGNNNLVITDFGRAFYWPMKMKTGEIRRNPVELNFPSDKFRVVSASCGYNFAALITSGGFLFTFGDDNSFGQLGVGDTEPRDRPTLVQTFYEQRERVTSVVCGFKHTICKTSAGKLYTWGWGGKGQLGHESYENELEPRKVKFEDAQDKVKPLQINAGYRHTMVLFEDRKIYWWGTSGELKEYHNPTLLEYGRKSPDIADYSEYAPFKINCTWSKSISLTYLTIADMRTVGHELNRAAKLKVINHLAAKIDEDQAYNDIHPPLAPTISKHFNNKTFRHYPLPKRQFKRTDESISSKMLTKKKIEQEKVFLLDEANGFKYTMGEDKDLVHLHEEHISYPKQLPKSPQTPKTPKTPVTPKTPKREEGIKVIPLVSPKSQKPKVPNLLFEKENDYISGSSSGRGNSFDSTSDSQISSFFSTHRFRTNLPKIEEENPNEINIMKENNSRLYERSPEP